MSDADYNNFDKFEKKIPTGDDRERLVCGDCGFIHYQNPKIVVGLVPRFGDKILLCRRAINPRKGFWTIPAGFMENGETTGDGALREAWEEAGIKPQLGSLLAVYSITRISQVHIFYKATLDSDTVSPGPESLEVKLFNWEDIPWNDLAFPTVHWVLNHARQTWDEPTPAPFTEAPKDWDFHRWYGDPPPSK